MKPRIDQAFWSDPDIEAQAPPVKLTALWLITNAQTSWLGVCVASSARFHFETGLPVGVLAETLAALPKSLVKIGDVVFVKNYIRHQFGTGEKLVRNNFFLGLKPLFLSIKDEDLRKALLTEYPEFQQALPKPLEGLPKPKRSTGKGSTEKRGSAEGDALRLQTSKAKASSKREVIEFAVGIGLPASEGEWFFEKCEGNGWTNDGKPIRDWKATVRSWKAAGYMPSQKNGGTGNAAHKAPQKLKRVDQ